MIFIRGDGPGSVQHFAHFMMDYFIDVALWCVENPGRTILVRDCGPCNGWFDLLPGTPEVSIVAPEELAVRANTAPGEQVLTTSHSFWQRNPNLRLPQFREEMVTASNIRPARRRIMAVRTTEPDFYISPDSEAYGSGSGRRRIGNQDLLASDVERRWNIESVEFFEVMPSDAVSTMAECSLFVAQRGAAMMNMLFMPRGAHVIEVIPREFGEEHRNANLYRDACKNLGLSYSRLWQHSEMAPVSSARFTMAIRVALVSQWLRAKVE